VGGQLRNHRAPRPARSESRDMPRCNCGGAIPLSVPASAQTLGELKTMERMQAQ
jgi:hypothetical protein